MFPVAKTGRYQIEWRENGRRLTRSLGHRDWVRAKRQAESRRHDRSARRMFLDFLGANRRPETLSKRDWDRPIRERRAGRIGPSGQPVAKLTIDIDLTFLIAVLNWAARFRDEEGRLLLDSSRLKGLRTPQGEEAPSGSSFPTRNTRRCYTRPAGRTGGSASRSCSLTRPGTASVPSGS